MDCDERMSDGEMEGEESSGDESGGESEGDGGRAADNGTTSNGCSLSRIDTNQSVLSLPRNTYLGMMSVCVTSLSSFIQSMRITVQIVFRMG